MNRVRGKFKSVHFGSKNGALTPFWAKQDFSRKKAPSPFSVYLIFTSSKKNQKKVTHGRTDRVEFIGPSGRARGPTKDFLLI